VLFNHLLQAQQEQFTGPNVCNSAGSVRVNRAQHVLPSADWKQGSLFG